MADSVSVAFDLMKSELETEIENLNSEGASLFRSSKYQEAAKLSERGPNLQKFAEKVFSLFTEWSQNFSESFPEEVVPERVREARKEILSASKSAKTGLMVRFPDGIVVSEKTAALTLALTVKHIGFERVRDLNKVVNGEPFVSHQRSEKKYGEVECDEFFIKTHSNTESKKRLLEDISNLLCLDIEISLI